MAINFESYVRNYAGANQPGREGATSVGETIGRGLAAIPTASDRIQSKASDILKDIWEPSLTMLSEDPDTWDANSYSFMDPGSAYKQFSESLSKREGRVGKRKGLLNPTDFIRAYNAQKDLYLPEVENHLLEYKSRKGLSDTDMRRFVNSKPWLSRMLAKSNEPTIKGWTGKVKTMGDVGQNILEGLGDMIDPSSWGDKTPGEFTKDIAGPVGVAGYGGYKLKKEGVFTKDKWKIPGMGRKGKIFGSEKYVKSAAKELLPQTQGKSSKELLHQAQSKYKSMSKKHGGPGQVGKDAKNLRKTIKNLEKRVAREVKRPQNFDDVKKLWSKLSKQYGGRKGVRKALFKAVGPARGAWMMARLGLGTAGSFIPEAVSTVAGVALTGYTLYQIAGILASMAEE